MFFAIKWHYDQGEKGETQAMLRTGGKMAAVFMLSHRRGASRLHL